MRAFAIAASIALFLAGVSARGDDRAAALGKQRAASSGLAWEVREAGHPVMGPVRFAHLKLAIATPVGNQRVYSSAYVSCELDAHTIAIELTNQRAPDDPGGLPAARPPKLICKSPAPAGGGMTQDVIDAHWQYNNLGDALARGFKPAALRACASIGIVQEVALPPGWAKPAASVEFEITPYARELDSVFASCGEASAYATRAQPAAAASSSAWKVARTVAHGKTNVRARPSTRSQVVARLDPGAVILVQRAQGDWWRAKSRNGDRFEGYIREDRLALQ